MYTANTMASAAEALGMALPGSASGRSTTGTSTTTARARSRISSLKATIARLVSSTRWFIATRPGNAPPRPASTCLATKTPLSPWAWRASRR